MGGIHVIACNWSCIVGDGNIIGCRSVHTRDSSTSCGYIQCADKIVIGMYSSNIHVIVDVMQESHDEEDGQVEFLIGWLFHNISESGSSLCKKGGDLGRHHLVLLSAYTMAKRWLGCRCLLEVAGMNKSTISGKRYLLVQA